MDITLGLDFGTHQSKLCMSYMPNNETIYEFFEFTLDDGTKSVLLPSVIQINKDNTIRVGSVDYDDCATRDVPPPQRPTLPPRPVINLPPEPDITLPPEPQLKPQKQAATKGTDWKDVLKGIKASWTTPKNDKDNFKKEHDLWVKKCQIINERHREWEKRCRLLNQKLEPWQREVDAMNAHFDEEYAYWQQHKTEHRVFRYFKQATLTSTMPWNHNEIPAATLSIWYLTYLLLSVKRYVKEKFNEPFEESVSVQMGVPSGLNDNISKAIQYRGQRLLVSARHLMELFDSPEEMCLLPYTELIEKTEHFKGDVNKEAEEYGFVVMPEAYAGLQSLTVNQRLKQGKMHLLVDIGGGTTDIAFFTIDKSFLPTIHTVTSFDKGLNFVMEQFIKNNPEYSMGEAQALLMNQTKLFGKAISTYTNELKKELNLIIDHVISEFNEEVVGTELSTSRLVDAMMGRPIVYCGGGSVLPHMRVTHHYFSDLRQINKDTLNIPNLSNRDLPPELFTIIATSYGLAVPTVDDIKTVDARQLWKTVADCVRANSSRKHNERDYGLMDD